MVSISWLIPGLTLFHQCNYFVLLFVMFSYQVNANGFSTLLSTFISQRKTASPFPPPFPLYYLFSYLKLLLIIYLLIITLNAIYLFIYLFIHLFIFAKNNNNDQKYIKLKKKNNNNRYKYRYNGVYIVCSGVNGHVNIFIVGRGHL